VVGDAVGDVVAADGLVLGFEVIGESVVVLTDGEIVGDVVGDDVVVDTVGDSESGQLKQIGFCGDLVGVNVVEAVGPMVGERLPPSCVTDFGVVSAPNEGWLVGVAVDTVVFVTPVLVTVTTSPSTSIVPVAISVARSASTAGSTGVPSVAGNPTLTTTDPQSNCISSVDPSIVWDTVQQVTILALIAVSSAAL